MRSGFNRGLIVLVGLAPSTVGTAAWCQKFTFEMDRNAAVFEWIGQTAGKDEQRLRAWPPLVVDGFGVVYIQLSSIQAGDIRSMNAWTRKDYYSPFETDGGDARSELIQYEIKCGYSWSARVKYHAYYDRLGAEGHRLGRSTNGDWWPIEPSSTEDLIAKFVCRDWTDPNYDFSAPGIR